jgi:hypothetical protein
MIETVDEIAEARALVEQRQRELRSAELALSDWKSNRHTGGFPVKSLDLGTMRTRDAFAVDTSSFESRENMLQSAIHGCSVRLVESQKIAALKNRRHESSRPIVSL